MVDVFDATTRSRIMRSVRGQNTRPEMIVRGELHRCGYRYRLHHPDLAGRPDLTFVTRRKVIFIHGCFWHRHACPAGRSTPASRAEYWLAKFQRNQQRDRNHRRRLRQQGWKVFVIWECHLNVRRRERTIAAAIRFLES